MSVFVNPSIKLPRRAVSLDDAPASPSVWDDEFDSDTLDPKWERFGGPFDDDNAIDQYTSLTTHTRTSLNGLRKSWWMTQCHSSGSARLVQPITLPDICFLWARFSFNARWNSMPNDDGTAQLSLCSASGDDRDFNNRVYVYLNESDTNTVQVQGGQVVSGTHTSAVLRNLGPSGGSGVGVDTKIQHACYVGIQKILTTYITCIGWPGGNWQTITNHSLATTFNRISLEFLNTSTNAPGSLMCGVDFFRVQDWRFQP